MAEKKEHKKKHKFSHTHIEHFHDGSGTVHHVHEDGPEHDVKHAAGDLDEMHDSMEQHLGQPNDGEGQVAAAGPAPAPVVPGAVPGM
jgi:hypothetical protein